jgi:nucleoside-triphosphatase THEP1
MADMLERLLTKISDDPSMPQKVIVIDEVDCFQQNEKSFNTIITRVLKGSSKQSKTKTTIIGIANSVDLPFKKKNSAIG